MIDQVVKPEPAKQAEGQPENRPPEPPPKPAELDQDAGGGYNPDHTDPQT